MMRSKMRFGGGLVLVLSLFCLGFFPPFAGADEFPYALDEELSLTGDCSTTPGIDEIKDPDCEPTYLPPPDGPSGRFSRPFSLVVDDWGNLYVASRSSDGSEGRIDVFDSEGRFITELQDPFGPQSITVDGEGNLYAYEIREGKVEIVRYPPATYNPAAREIDYDENARIVVADTGISFIFNGLAIDRQDVSDSTDDRLYVGQTNQIRIYGSAKEGNSVVDTITPAGLNFATFAVVDAQRRLLYTTHCKEGLSKCVIWVLSADAPYAFIKEIDGKQTPAGGFFSNQGKLSIAVDETNGHLFVGDLSARNDFYEFDEDYNFVSTFEVPGAPTGGVQSDVAENREEEAADNFRYLYVPLSPFSGSAFAFAPPSITAPKIKAVFAQNIGATEAELVGLIEPGQLATDYLIEYVTTAQYEIDEFDSATVAKSGNLPGVKTALSISALLTGLTPGNSYRFRITAENEINLGDPVEEEGTFSTFNDANPHSSCSNTPLRVGPSAALPDCRAYELVTPPGARGPEGAGFEGERFGSVQSSIDGSSMSFEIKAGALPGTEATGYFHGDPYLAKRTATGWSTALAGPTGTMASKPKPGSFSSDQGYSFFTADGDGSAVIGDQETYYVRYPDGRSELIGRGSLDTDPRARGRMITKDGIHIVFETLSFVDKAQKLEPNAPEEGIAAVYDRFRDPITGMEETHVVSLLPDDVTPSQPATYAGASADGEGIAFTIGTTLYLRYQNEATYEIGPGTVFAGISDGGERIFYLEGGDLKAFDVGSEEEIDFTGSEISTATPVNVAPQGARAYFISEAATGSTGPNGDTAQPGAQNLYLSEEGVTTFVATVTERDVEGFLNVGTGARGDGLGLWTESLQKRQPPIDPSRLTPDGTTLVFHSRANIDDYDPEGEAQIYRYDLSEERLHCISCPPAKTPATGGAKLQSLGTIETAPFSAYGFVPALMPDGERLLFESTEALVSSDTDGLLDVYEWEEEGVGSCTREDGCVYLLSSPGSSKAEFLFGHSQSGDDVFISTSDVLVPGSPQTISIYDARVNGGFAVTSKEICPDESCRPALTPPPVLPQIGIGNQSGNLLPQPKKCPPGKRKVKRKGKVVCVKKHKKQRRHKQRKAAAERGMVR